MADDTPLTAVEQAIDDLRVAWSPDLGSFSREECEERLANLIAAVRAEQRVCCVCSQPTISGGYVCDVCFAAPRQ